jgi:hypothetical protein
MRQGQPMASEMQIGTFAGSRWVRVEGITYGSFANGYERIPAKLYYGLDADADGYAQSQR